MPKSKNQELLDEYPNTVYYAERDGNGGYVYENMQGCAYTGASTQGGFVNKRIASTNISYRLTTNAHRNLSKIGNQSIIEELERAIVIRSDMREADARVEAMPLVEMPVETKVMVDANGVPLVMDNESLIGLKKDEIIELAKQRFDVELDKRETRVDLIDKYLDLQTLADSSIALTGEELTEGDQEDS